MTIRQPLVYVSIGPVTIGLCLGFAWLSRAEEQSALHTSRDQTAEAAKVQGDSKPSPSVENDTQPPRDEPVRSIVSGKVVLLSAALKKRGIKAYAEEINETIVLESRAGELIPIVPDWRGRALYQDERLRDRPVDLVVNRRRGIPWVQVLSIYTFDEQGTRNITDYWCDICAIPMYEIKDCDCCQAPIRLRFRPQGLPNDTSAPVAGKKP